MIIDIPKTLTEISNNGFSDAFVGKWVGINSRTVFGYRHGQLSPSLKTATKIHNLHKVVTQFMKDLEEINN